jgi:large subunit ribosomal protein L18
MKNKQKVINQKLQRRHVRVRAKVQGDLERPRLSVFRSAKHLYLQIINDETGKTLVYAKDQEIKAKVKPVEIAMQLGELLAKKAIAMKITKVVFDRGIYQYHGRIKAVAEGARKGGLEF